MNGFLGALVCGALFAVAAVAADPAAQARAAVAVALASIPPSPATPAPTPPKPTLCDCGCLDGAACTCELCPAKLCWHVSPITGDRVLFRGEQQVGIMFDGNYYPYSSKLGFGLACPPPLPPPPLPRPLRISMTTRAARSDCSS